MIYKEFKGEKISALGLGCMRLPTIDNDYSKIDEKQAREMVAYAMANGINYYDTAWGYHEGKSEPTMGKILSKYPRESFFLASKFPGYDVNNIAKSEEVFQKQLERCQTPYFDFYLFHSVTEDNSKGYIDNKEKLLSYFSKMKEEGKIRHIGFSAHAPVETMKRFLDAFGEIIEFVQLQINYVDWNHQKAKEKVEFLASHNLPVWVMEPVRGGNLAKFDEESKSSMEALRKNVEAPEWAFRFIQSIPEVVVTLSGMSNMEQLKANIETFKKDAPTNETEKEALFTVAKKILGCVPCTKCRYCTQYCPMELEIPKLLALYNEFRFTGGNEKITSELDLLGQDKLPGACIACHSCENVCPQQIAIPNVLADFAKRLK